MTTEFSGEQKLRIVLESIIRNVPKSEQSQKYGISEEEFQKWHDHLIQNGGKIFDVSSRPGGYSGRSKKKMSPLAKFFLTGSLMTNLGLIIVGVVYYLNSPQGNEKVYDSTNPIDSPIHLSDKTRDVTQEENLAKNSIDDESVDVLMETAKAKPLPLPNEGNQIENLLANPEVIPNPTLIPPSSIAESTNEVIFLNQSYQGRHVVYLLDVGTYLLESNQSVQQFERAKEELISSIVTLSPNSYFNLVLYWNLRETAALGKTILQANRENKKYAIDWITSLGNTIDSLKTDRNQYYPKELLYAKPNPGIIGPWYGLSTAISYDPDLIFVLAGNLPSYDRKEVPRSHYEGLGKIDFSLIQNTQNNLSSISPLDRETARKWFYDVSSIEDIPSSESEVEAIAFARLGIVSDKQQTFMPLNWERAFENFLSSLEVGFDRIPQTHFFVSLPRYGSWPSSLLNSAKEFAETSRGSYQQNIFIP